MGNEKRVVFRPLRFAPVFKKIKKLQYDRRFRDAQKLFFAEGVRNFVRAVENKHKIETIIYSEKLLIVPIARKFLRNLKREGVPFVRLTPEQFRLISKTERASGVAVIIRQPIQKLKQIKLKQHFCWTVVSHIRSAGNLGTLLRTSSAIGAGGLILIGNRIDPFDSNVIRATMGAIFKQRIVRTNNKEFANWVKSNDLQVVGASPNALENYNEISYSTPTILMLGNERSGLTKTEESFCKNLVRIPMTEGTDSLNVAVAGSLLLYEVFRNQ